MDETLQLAPEAAQEAVQSAPGQVAASMPAGMETLAGDYMGTAVFVATILFATIAVYKIIKGGRRAGRSAWQEGRDAAYDRISTSMPYRRAQFLSVSEEKFLRALMSAVKGEGLSIFAKPRLIDLAEPFEPERYPYAARGDYDTAMRLVWAKHVDFVLYSMSAGRVVAAIEYDGPKHAADAKTIENDRFKERVLERAGIPLVRFPAMDWRAGEIRAQLELAIGLDGGGQSR